MSAREHIDEMVEYALGTLPAAAHETAREHLATCPHCALELQATLEALSALPLARGPQDHASGGRERLLAHVARGGRLHRFAERVAALLGITADRAAHWLDRLDAPDNWHPLPLPGGEGIRIMRPDHAPALDGCAVAFLRIPPGARFPEHGHLADERVLILQGGYVEEPTGVDYRAGDLHFQPEGGTHSFRNDEPIDCLCLGVVLGKIRVGNHEIG